VSPGNSAQLKTASLSLYIATPIVLDCKKMHSQMSSGNSDKFSSSSSGSISLRKSRQLKFVIRVPKSHHLHHARSQLSMLVHGAWFSCYPSHASNISCERMSAQHPSASDPVFCVALFSRFLNCFDCFFFCRSLELTEVWFQI
jgi:hypothetical protein